jgi:hypothetical protein
METRSYKNSWRDEIIHINLNFLISLNIPSFPADISIDGSVFGGSSNQVFLKLDEISGVLEETEYNSLIIKIFKSCENYYQTNIVMPHIEIANNLNSQQVNEIAEYCLENTLMHRSFEVQRRLLSFIHKNKRSMKPTLFLRLLRDFPHTPPGFL